jgi:hypothetical protein
MPDNEAVTAWGVHGWRGSWLVNGSSSGLVRFEIEPAVRALIMGIPVRRDAAAECRLAQRTDRRAERRPVARWFTAPVLSAVVSFDLMLSVRAAECSTR